MKRPIRPNTERAPKPSAAQAEPPTPSPPPVVAWRRWAFPLSATPRRLWAGLKPIRFESIDRAEDDDGAPFQIAVDGGDMDAQAVLEGAGITEEQWDAANGARKRVLLRGARLVSALIDYLTWAADTNRWPGAPSLADEAQVRASELIQELVAHAERSLKGAKGHAHVLNRMLASEWWPGERAALIAQLKWAKKELDKIENESLREASRVRLVTIINKSLVRRFGHDALRVGVDHLRLLARHSPTYVAQQLLLGGRFEGVATVDDTTHKQLRVARGHAAPRNNAP